MCEGYEISFELDFQMVNGSLVSVLRPKITKCPEDPGPIIAASFLSLVFLVAFLLNIMVVVTVATSFTLKRLLYCHLLINICMASIIDCCLNLSVAVAYILSAPWRFGYGVCYFNGYTINMMNSVMAFAVLLLAVDRLAAAKKYSSYLNMPKYKLRIVICFTWLVAFLLASPLVCGFITSMPYRKRYSCSVADPIDDYYLIAHLVLIVCVPTIVMVVLGCVTSMTFHKERRKQKKVKGNNTVGYFDQILMTPYFRNEFHPAMLVSCVVIAYLLLWLPFTALTTITPMFNQDWAINETADEVGGIFDSLGGLSNKFKFTRAMVDESQLRALNSTGNMTNMTPDMSNLTMTDYFIPEIDDTSVFDTVAIWFHFLFHLFVPILIFVVLRDVRAKCEALVMWCRPNSVDVASPKPARPPYSSRLQSTGTSDSKNGTASSQKKPKNNKNIINFKTPILFSTSEGLHIRTVEDTYLGMIENKPLLPFNRQSNEEPKYAYSLCDVSLGYEDLTDFDVQFEINDNYDFERDPEVAGLEDGNPLVMDAHRAAMGQKPNQTSPGDEDDDASIKMDFRPPTPPKVQVMGNEPAVSFGDVIEVEEPKKPKKGKKTVRFSEEDVEIPRPDTAESSILNSSANSSRSSDSGIMADTERNSAQGDEVRKPRFSVNQNRHRPDRKPVNLNKPQSKPRPPRRPPASFKKPPPAKSSPNSRAPKKVVSSKVKNIKSRHVRSLEDGSLTSLDSPQSAPKPRRLSRQSDSS